MHSISSANSQRAAYLAELAAQNSTQAAGKPASSPLSETSASQADSVHLSVGDRQLLQAGRIALNEKAGNITSNQATQLYAQLAATEKQIAADKAADGGTLSAADAASIQQTEDQTGQQIYSTAHNGATPPTTAPPASSSELRDLAQVGRISLNENAGRLTSTQASSLSEQIHTTQQQIVAEQKANGGPLTPAQAAAIKQLQDQLSSQINSDANSSAN